ncbi:MAG TPA: zf-HC2 domain-containing protein [Bacillota bacterium]|nr:hypothetical protein [Clostridiales bacterium]HPT85410.1 zf-HC2 domain-containing protein [Bacillota bacterium]
MKAEKIIAIGKELKKAARKLFLPFVPREVGEGMACEVVRDLIPLYADGATSEMTGSFVRAHIDACGECADFFRSVVAAAREKRMSRRAQRLGVGGFAGIAGKIRRRRAAYASVTTVALLVLVGLNIYAFLTRGGR